MENIQFLFKGQILVPFSGLEIFPTKNSRVGSMCIKESFDTLLNMGYGGGAYKWFHLSLLAQIYCGAPNEKFPYYIAFTRHWQTYSHSKWSVGS